MSKNDILDQVFTATCKLELMRTVIETLINMVEDNGDIKTPEQAMDFAYIQGTIDDFLHITLDGVCFAIQTLNEAQNSTEDEERKEIAELLSSIDNAWTLDQIKQFTINMAEEGGKE